MDYGPSTGLGVHLACIRLLWLSFFFFFTLPFFFFFDSFLAIINVAYRFSFYFLVSLSLSFMKEEEWSGGWRSIFVFSS